MTCKGCCATILPLKVYVLVLVLNSEYLFFWSVVSSGKNVGLDPRANYVQEVWKWYMSIYNGKVTSTQATQADHNRITAVPQIIRFSLSPDKCMEANTIEKNHKIPQHLYYWGCLHLPTPATTYLLVIQPPLWASCWLAYSNRSIHPTQLYT